MGKFITELKAKQISEGTYKSNAIWELTDHLIYDSNSLGLVIVDCGTKTDFSSVPRLPILYLFANGMNNAPTALHDKLYSEGHDTGRLLNVTRLQADNLLFEASINGFMSYPLAAVSWIFVRCFGWWYWRR